MAEQLPLAKLTAAQKRTLLSPIADRDLGGRSFIVGNQRTIEGLLRLGLVELGGIGPYFLAYGRRMVRLTKAGEAERIDRGGNLEFDLDG